MHFIHRENPPSFNLSLVIPYRQMPIRTSPSNHPPCVQTALYLSLCNKRNVLPLQQNPAQLPSLVLLRMYLHSIINHQIHKLVKALLTVSTRPQKQRGNLL